MGLFSKKKKDDKAEASLSPSSSMGMNPLDAPPSKGVEEGSSFMNPKSPLSDLDDIKEHLGDMHADADPLSGLDTKNDSLFDMSDLDFHVPQNSSPLPTVAQASGFENKGAYNFSSQNSSEAFFITTEQYKKMLEIVESVKGRIKAASETHLRLQDIKAEEDIEYENMRKDFLYVEDKLYELDKLIFEKSR